VLCVSLQVLFETLSGPDKYLARTRVQTQLLRLLMYICGNDWSTWCDI